MDILAWAASFDRYALAGSILKQFTYGAAVARKNECLRIAFETHLENGYGGTPRGRHLGVIYDRLCRITWAERSVAADVQFDLESAARTRDAVVLSDAKAFYDNFKKSKERSPDKGFGK